MKTVSENKKHSVKTKKVSRRKKSATAERSDRQTAVTMRSLHHTADIYTLIRKGYRMIKADHLTVVYPDGRKALDDISFSLEEGKKTALIGANGAGKSTLLLSLVGIVPATSGTITVGETVLSERTLREIREKVGFVFQNPDDQLFMSKVEDDIAFGPRNYGIPEDEIDRRMTDVLENLGISHLKERLTSHLSGGEKRRVAVATVLVMEPSVLIFDEPSSYLDPRSRLLLMKEIASLKHTQLIATHDLDLALDICDRAIILQDGKIMADGPADELLKDRELLEGCGLEMPLSLSRK